MPDILKYRLICCTVLPAFLRLMHCKTFGGLTVPVLLLPYFGGSPKPYMIFELVFSYTHCIYCWNTKTTD